jgi:hypothetical protein
MVAKKIKVFLQWAVALAVGFCIVNLLCMGYERLVGWIETPNGPSPAHWNPGAILVHGTEGYGITKIDQNGYINPDGTLEDSHILCMGSSHTQGKELPSGKNYTALLNTHFAAGEGSLAAYNIACDGNFLPSLIKHFPAAVEAFPNASAITIEISNTDISVEELEYALEQAAYVQDQTAQLGLVSKLKMLIKEYFPLLNLIKSKLETAASAAPAGAEAVSQDAAALLREALELIRSQYDGEIIFIYHQQTGIAQDGTIVFDEDRLFDVFAQACQDNGIRLLDMRPVFVEYYNLHQELPYGFANTRPGNGHLNKLGHRLIAEALIPYLEEAMA